MDKEIIASVKGTDLPISTKHAIEICSFIRNKKVETAKKQLNLVLEKQLAIPLKKFHKDRGHRKGKIGPGFYPQKATKEVLNLLSSLESNSSNKGLNNDFLYLTKAIANRASAPMHFGRQRGTEMKRTHIELVGKEKETKKQKQPATQETKKVEQKEIPKPKEQTKEKKENLKPQQKEPTQEKKEDKK